MLLDLDFMGLILQMTSTERWSCPTIEALCSTHVNQRACNETSTNREAWL